jgi:glycosyltransferase involved in cell wall biosynthesis
LPVVSTPIGIEGIAARDGVEALIAADAESFARQVARVLTDDDLALGLRTAAHRLALEHYDTEVVGRRLLALLRGVVG